MKTIFKLSILSLAFLICSACSAQNKTNEKKGNRKKELTKKETTISSMLTLPVSDRVVKLLSVDLTKLLVNSSKVTIYEIEPLPEITSTAITLTHYKGFKIKKTVNTVNSDHFQNLKYLLLSPSSFIWDDVAKSCVFAPNFVASFTGNNGKDIVSTFFCFTCNEWQFQLNDKKPVKEDLDLARASLILFLKQNFKDSQFLKELK